MLSARPIREDPMFRYYTPRHRLTLRILIGIGCVVVLLATGCGAH